MGLGKTLMTISLIVSDFDQSDINRVEVKTETIAKSSSDIIDLVDEISNDDDDDDNDDNNDDDDDEDFILEKKRKLKVKNKSVKVFKSQNNNPNTSFISNSGQVPSFFTKRTQSKKTYGTLIVTPMSLMGQWIDEIKNKTSANSVSSYMYYGNNTNIDISSVDIVVTSYGTLVSEAKSFLKAMSGLSTEEKQDIATLDDIDISASALRKGLLAVKWKRVVLDEGHTIKNPLTEVAKACTALLSERRWVLSGTPIQNSLDDLYSLIRYLKHEPWDQPRWWRRTISEPNTSGDERSLIVLRTLLDDVMLRRTKVMKDPNTGQPIVSLPTKTITIEYIELEDAEKEFYSELAERSQAVFRGFEQGLAGLTLRNRYSVFFTLLLRMRQSCNHPYLVLKQTEESNNAISNNASNDIKAMDTTVNDKNNDDDDNDASNDDDAKLFGQEFLGNLYNKLYASLKSKSSSDDSSSSGSPLFLRQVKDKINLLANDNHNHNDNDRPECAVCLEEYTIANAIIILKCGHILCQVLPI